MSIRVKKVKCKLPYLKENPTVYKIAQVNEQPVTYSKLLENVTGRSGANKGMVKYVVDALIASMVDYMELGHRVQLGEFGTLKLRLRSRVQEKLEDVSVKDVASIAVQYIPGKEFRDLKNNINIELLPEQAEENTNDDTGGNETGGGDDNNPL